MPSDRPYQSRYTRVRALAGVLTASLILAVVSAVEINKPFFWDTAPVVFLVSLTWLNSLFMCWQSRRKALEEKKTMLATVGRPGPRPQSFFWQGVLILLPVAAMAGFGFWAILRERNAVEQEARQRAQEIIQTLPTEFGRMAANQLSHYETYKQGWYFYLQGGVAAWPGNGNEYLDDTNEAQIISNELAALHSAFPNWHDGPVPILSFGLDTNGGHSSEIPTPPKPPAWLATMSTEQSQAWSDFQTAAYAAESSSNLDGWFKAFQQTQPPTDALACAEFVQLRAGLSSSSATNAINQLLLFANHHYRVISESGLPLRTLALAEALKAAQQSGPTGPLWNALQSEVSSPSALTPMLLDEAGSLVVNNARLTEGITAMRILVDDMLASDEMAVAVMETGKVNGATNANLWLDAMDQRWFCTINRSVALCYPKSLVARALADAFADANTVLPDYFSLSVDLEGEPVPLSPSWGHFADGKPAGDILAEEHFQMHEPGVLSGWRDAAGSHPGQNPYEAMPSHPGFSVQILLTDRKLLFARQRELQWIFGALIAASALAALVGFAAAYRAFHRQLALNEMKTNFVSSVSHELRAPIASVRLMAEGLERGKILEPAKQGEYFKFIVQECRRLSSLIENVLDFSRIEEGCKRYEMEPTDLVALTEQTVKLMEVYAAERQTGITLRVSGEATPVDADGKALQQALVNLIDNAIKHSPKGASIGVGLDFGKDGLVRISVEDHGEGIAVSEQEKIFERFYRVGSELRRETQGVGIGLSIVKHIVEAHGGRVTVRSAPGRGSCFTIELPGNGKSK